MIKDEVKDMIAKQLRVDVNTIDDDANIITDLNADSIDLVELLMIIEENLGITISDEEAMELKTVRDIVNFIEEHE